MRECISLQLLLGTWFALKHFMTKLDLKSEVICVQIMQNIIHQIYLFVMAHVTCVTIENTKSLDPVGEKVISNLGAFCTSIYHTSFHINNSTTGISITKLFRIWSNSYDLLHSNTYSSDHVYYFSSKMQFPSVK